MENEWNLVAISPGMETHSMELGHGILYRETIAGVETIVPDETPGPTPGLPEELEKLYAMQTAKRLQCPSMDCAVELALNPSMELRGGIWVCPRCSFETMVHHGRQAMTAEELYLWNVLLATKSEEWFINSKGETT
jgi:hypothetical protein